MIIVQITIFTILGFFWILSYFKTSFNLKENIKSFFWFLLFVFSSFFFILIAFILTIHLNKISEELKGKCPELEKVDNIYRIKK